MVESWIDWLAGLPPVAIYGVIALMAAIENIFPPFPADTAIALGAFLAHRGVTEPWLVFAVTFVANIGGAMLMYAIAYRNAAVLFRWRFARRFLPETALVRVREEYGRYGVAGLFIGRILPGFRAMVAPFAGLIHLSPWRAFIPMAFASAIWYGGLIFLAAQLGNQFDRILEIIGSINVTLGILSGVAFAIIGVLMLRRRRRRRAASDAATAGDPVE
jgi:membrane protein DedA with SNARE-associated domain